MPLTGEKATAQLEAMEATDRMIADARIDTRSRKKWAYIREDTLASWAWEKGLKDGIEKGIVQTMPAPTWWSRFLDLFRGVPAPLKGKLKAPSFWTRLKYLFKPIPPQLPIKTVEDEDVYRVADVTKGLELVQLFYNRPNAPTDANFDGRYRMFAVYMADLEEGELPVPPKW